MRKTVLALTLCSCMRAADVPAATAPDLNVSYVEGSSSEVILEQQGRRYVIDLAAHTVHDLAAPPAAQPRRDPPAAAPQGAEVFQRNCARCHGPDGRGIASVGTPDFTRPQVQASITDEQIIATITNGRKGTPMPAWGGKLSSGEILAAASHIRSFAAQPQAGQAAQAAEAKTYTPGDDVLMTLPTGRTLDRGGLYVNFTHRFAFDPAFSGQARGNALLGLDGFSLSSFGFRYGVTKRLYVQAFRSPTFISRPIQFMAGYDLLYERDGAPLNATARFSIEGQNNFSRNFAESLELILSRSIRTRAQFYFVPTFSFNARHLFMPNSYLSSAIPNLPGYNTISTGVGASVDVRPSVALVAEVIPTVLNGRPLGIHRPEYAFGVQKKIWRHAFTIGFTNGPAVTVSQRAATRAALLNNPEADEPSGLFIGFDITRQLF